MNRSERRFQDEKHKMKTKRLIKDVWHEDELADDEKFVGRQASVHAKACSCPACCSRRNNPWAKSKRLTVQERRELQDEGDE